MTGNLLARSPLATRWDPKVSCVVTLTLVFLCGTVVGAVAMNLGAHKLLHTSSIVTAPGRAMYLESLQKELELTPQQTEEMRSILDDFTKYYKTVLQDGKQRMFQILNENQRRKLERMIQEQKKP